MTLSAPSEPRLVHYLFAHRAVPRAFLQAPSSILPVMCSDQGMEFLSGMWDLIVREVEAEDTIDRSPLKIDAYELKDDVWVALVTMPPPHRVFEAYFVACVAKFGSDTIARAFTLDLAGPPVPDAPTGILEWDAEGKHELLDEQCPAKASDFVDTVERIVTSPVSPR